MIPEVVAALLIVSFPGSISIPTNIASLSLSNVLADVGSNINLMPYSLFQLIFPVDFVILEMDEDERLPLILGRPFLATSRALIIVLDGKLTLRVTDDHVTFDVSGTITYPTIHRDTLSNMDTCTVVVSQSLLGCPRESVGMHVVDHRSGMRVKGHGATMSRSVQKVGDELVYMNPPCIS
ncbi:hypothetical protein QVD17_30102 [Tagetes erecta]|uniref:Reverse transcriptase domain-containing protein n=1 Tax=Tagetes erecta TaxID=13708 RepID=A0AAD8K254_TARER|nr:hypothetical protein QVD17_30102 [Tagetes erecta]